MAIAPTTAIIAVLPIVPPVPVVREPEPPPRARAKKWVAPSTIDRGQLIDLLV